MMLSSTTLLQRLSGAVRCGPATVMTATRIHCPVGTAMRMHRMQALTTFAGVEARQPAQRGGRGVVDPLAYKASQRLAAEMRQKVTTGSISEAWEMFDAARASGAADVLHWGMMLELCDTSTDRQIMMEEMEAAGVKLTAVTYINLLRQLMLEGMYEEARAVVEREMPAAGVVPDNRTYAVLDKSEESLSKMRMAHLQGLIKAGTPKAKEQAQVFFDRLKANGAAGVFHWSVMQRLRNSTGQRSMMDEMEAADVKPGAAIYNMLIRQLVFEGMYEEARAVVEREMPAAGVVPDEHTHAVFKKSEQEWSKIRMHHLQDLLKAGTPKAKEQAQAFFDELKANGAAGVFHWSVMQRLRNSTGQRSMMDEMEAAGVKPDVTAYTMLAGQLMFEGMHEEARAVLEREMPAAGVVPNDRTHAVFEKSEEIWSRMRRRRLQDLLKEGTPKSKEQAQAFFDGLKANGVADVFHWSVMHQHSNSTERRSMMDEMEAAGVKPDASVYTMLAGQLMLEGMCEEARAVVEREMPAAGVVPNDRTHGVFEKSEEIWNKMRMKHLQNLHEANTPKAKEQAQAFFDGLKVSGAANVFHWNVMQQLNSYASTQRRGMMDEMEAAGVKPDVVSYTMLARQLMVEGMHEEARAVVEREMPAAGVVPDDRTHAVFERSDEEWNKNRTRRLQDLLKEGTPKAKEQAQALFDRLKANGAAGVFHWSVMQRLRNSTGQRSMMDEMEAAGVKPGASAYTMLAGQLMVEGMYEEARAVVEREMPAAGVVPNDRTHAVFKKSEQEWSRMRRQRLQDLLKEGTPKAKEQAQAFFDGLKANGVADVFHWSVMHQHSNSTERRSMIEEVEAAGVKPGASAYNMLIHQFMFEGMHEEARAVLEREMPAAGVVPDDRTHAVFEKSEQEWSRMRTRRLQELLKEGTPKSKEQAQALFDRLKASGAVHRLHMHVMDAYLK